MKTDSDKGLIHKLAEASEEIYKRTRESKGDTWLMISDEIARWLFPRKTPLQTFTEEVWSDEGSD